MNYPLYSSLGGECYGALYKFKYDLFKYDPKSCLFSSGSIIHLAHVQQVLQVWFLIIMALCRQIFRMWYYRGEHWQNLL